MYAVHTGAMVEMSIFSVFTPLQATLYGFRDRDALRQRE